LWLIDSATGTRRLITQGRFAAPVWSPDGKRLAAIQYSGEYPNQQQQIVILEIGPLLGSR
jgi:Tol biopolymer transport system component